MSVGEVARIAAEVLTAIPFPALVLDVPSGRIVASSPAATRLVDPEGGMTVGHLLEEFTADRPTAGLDRFAGGRLDGVESVRVLRRPHGAALPVRMWIRPFDTQPVSRFVVVVLVPDTPIEDGAYGKDWQNAPAVVGTADVTLLIERISNDAEELFDRPVAALIGGPLVALVAEPDVAGLLAALDEVSSTGSGVTLYLDLRAGLGRSPIRCEVLLLPLQPAPSCAFVFLPMPGGRGQGHIVADLSGILLRLGRGAEIAQLVRGVFRGITERSVPGLGQLTTRELEVLTQLVDGERVPAIAAKLFLSRGTVRNHLASIFGKLGVTSQQELVTVIVAAQGATGPPEGLGRSSARGGAPRPG